MTLINQDYQVSIAPAADDTLEFLLGNGTPYFVDEFLGLDVDDIRTDDTARPLQHGLFPGMDLLGGRDLTMGVVTFGTTGDARSADRTPARVAANQDALVGAWTARSVDLSLTNPDDPNMVLRYRLPGQGVRRFYGRARKIARQDNTIPMGYAGARLQFSATDPRAYADDETVVNVQVIGSGTGGLTFPATFPVNIAPNTDGTAYATNDGNISTDPVIIIQGPVTNPVVQNYTDGTFIQVNLVLASGQTLVIDSAEKRVLLGGTASRAGQIALGSTFPRLLPGVNTLRLGGTIASGDQPVLSVAFRSAWL